MDFIQNAYESEQEEGHCQNTIEHQEAKYHAIEDAIQEEDCKRKRIAEKFMQRQKNFQHKHHKATQEEKDFLYRKYQCKRHHSVNQQEKRNKVEKETDHINVSPLVDELFSTLDEKQRLLETHKTSSKWHCHERILAHSSQVNFIDWNKQYPSLLLSCSMDSTLCVWHHIPNTTICRRQMNGHSKGVSDAKWTLSG
jgi:WD40 repeat protein